MEIIQGPDGQPQMQYNAVDKLIRFGSNWDWITPLYGMIMDYIRRPAMKFYIPLVNGYSGFEVSRHLKQRGLQLWAMMIIGDDIVFCTRQAQYWLICRALDEIGVVYTHSKVDKAAARRRKTAKRQPNFAQRVLAWLEE